MRRLQRLRRRAADARGFSLPELLVAMMIGMIVSAAGLTMVIVAVQAQPQTTERAGQIQQGRWMLERVTRELRQGQSVLSSSPSQLELLTYVPVVECGGAASELDSRLCRVSYTCDAASCVRSERAPDGTGAASSDVVASGISGPSVFSFQGAPTDPTFVGVRLVFPQDDGTEAVTLEDGAALRNYFDSEPAA